MFEQNLHTKTIFISALLIGIIGASGQSFILNHELVDCYPYKVIDGFFYQNIAKSGVYIAPLIGIAFGFYFGIRKFWLASIAPVILCPLIFAFLAGVFTFFNADANAPYFDGKSINDATGEFTIFALNLAAVGLVISLIVNFVLSYFSKKLKDKYSFK